MRRSEITPELIVKKTDELMNDIDSGDWDANYAFIKSLLSQQRRVTREEVEEIACDLKGEMIIEDIMEMIIAWLKELEIGVVKSKEGGGR